MVNDYWMVWVSGIASAFGIYYGYRRVNAFAIFAKKLMANDYWIESVFVYKMV